MFKHRLRDAISNIILVCLVLAGVLLLVALLFPLCSNLIFGSISNKYQAELYYMYEHDEEHDVFYENETELEESINDLNEAYEIIPKHISDIVKNEWEVVIAMEPPYKNDAKFALAGVTYPLEKVVWVQTNSNKEVYLHEFGHVLDHILGYPSESTIFYAIYQNNWDSYFEFGETEIVTHNVSDSGEFFAALFVDYCLHPEYLEENLYEGFQFFERMTRDGFNYTGVGRYFNVDIELIRSVSTLIDIHKPYKKLNTVIGKVNKSVQNNQYINPEEYEVVVDYEWMLDKPEFFVNMMMDFIENPDKYPDNTKKPNQFVLKVEDVITFREYTDIVSFAVMYFGDELADPIDVNVVNNEYTEITFKKDLISEYLVRRNKSLERIDWVLENSIREGSETEMLIQISNFIINHAEYKINSETNTDTFWEDHTGDCVTYAMIFKQFANRIGIECDVIFVESPIGESHMYNRVTLSDGTHRYYDLTRNIVDDDQIDRTGFHINQFVTMANGINFYHKR